MNKKIRNATKSKIGNITFKSQLEKKSYLYLKELGFNVLYEPKTHILWDSFEPITPFYDKETDTQFNKRIEEGSNIKYKLLNLKKNKVIGIRYTPDFYLKYNNVDVYLETKGKENDCFYLKKKLFRKYLDDIYLKTKQKSIFFEIYTLKQLKQAAEIIKEL